MPTSSAVVEIVDATVSAREPGIVTITMRTTRQRGQRTLRLSVEAARDLVAQLDYCVWKASRPRPSA